MNTRSLRNGLTIDRSVFFQIGDSAILQTVDCYVKAVNRRHKDDENDNGSDGVSSIIDVSYTFDDKTASSMLGKFIHITDFEPIHRIEHERIINYDLMNKKYVKNTCLPSLSNSVQERKENGKQESEQKQQIRAAS